MDNNKIKIMVANKSRTVRFNPKKVRFEHNYGYKDNTGKQQSRVLTGNSIEDLTTEISNFESQLKKSSIYSKEITLNAYFEHYITNIAPAINRASTIRAKVNIWKSIPLAIKNKPIINLTIAELQIMYANLNKKYKQNTVKYLHQTINTILNSAVREKIIPENINEKCKVAGFTNGKKCYASPEDIKKFLAFVKNHKIYYDLYKPVLFLATTGCRKGECIGVKKEYMNPKDCTVRLEGQIMQDKHGSSYKTELKTPKSKRTIKLPKAVFDEIYNIETNDFVFLNKKGERWGSSNFSNKIKKAFVDFGMPDMSAKQMRNSFVKTAIKNNISLKIIQSILGHSRLATTADIYGELTQEDTYIVSDVMEKAFNVE